MVGVQGSSDPNRELLDAAALVGHLMPAGSVYAFLAEHRQRLFPDELFADLFPSGRGRPSVPADVIATVLVLQSLEGLSDRDAVQAVRTDLRWKVAAGLGRRAAPARACRVLSSSAWVDIGAPMGPRSAGRPIRRAYRSASG